MKELNAFISRARAAARDLDTTTGIAIHSLAGAIELLAEALEDPAFRDSEPINDDYRGRHAR